MRHTRQTSVERFLRGELTKPQNEKKPRRLRTKENGGPFVKHFLMAL